MPGIFDHVSTGKDPWRAPCKDRLHSVHSRVLESLFLRPEGCVSVVNSLGLSLSSSRDTGSVDEDRGRERDLATGSVDVGRCVLSDSQRQTN